MKLTITDVRKRYGDVVALDGVSFEVPSGSTFGVLGTNGAGKTTLFGLLVGHDDPDEGRLEVGGLDVSRAGNRVRERIGFLPDRAGFPGSMTGREVLDVHARLRGIDGRRERIAESLAVVGLANAADRAVSGYSNGMGRRLGLAAALLARPPVLVLDEPTAGLDPRGVATFHGIVERIDRETDATVVVASHALSEVERLCDGIAVLRDGRLCATGSIDEIRGAGGDSITVRVRPAGDPAALRESIRRYGPTATAGDWLEATCDRADAFDLLGSLDRERVERFEIREPGLEAAFHEIVARGDVGGDAHVETGARDGSDERRGTDAAAGTASEGAEP
ncbi:ABC transporter ATP-binding protein [Halegenticoccus tardaugens]|uniref:ABC transporter ATP-binding protein n=1 Tax=Halegenticoccus tardaugens TaxID=2071624 RepID=UPI00100AB17D|nr:ABC transporter ATP-binding protein [Halegenticoccus tardaugens]